MQLPGALIRRPARQIGGRNVELCVVFYIIPRPSATSCSPIQNDTMAKCAFFMENFYFGRVLALDYWAARVLVCLPGPFDSPYVPARAGVGTHDWPVDKLSGLEEWRDVHT